MRAAGEAPRHGLLKTGTMGTARHPLCTCTLGLLAAYYRCQLGPLGPAPWAWGSPSQIRYVPITTDTVHL